MNFLRKLPIGIQSFKDLREKNFLYVDKTEYLFRLVNNGKVYFLSRPRRFGKSLFLSTLAAYFLGQKELFKDLYLEKAEEEQARFEQRAAWEVYPVLYLDFNVGKYTDSGALNERLHIMLCAEESVYGISPSKEEQPFFASRFEKFLKIVYQQTGKQVVILVDEYDKPLLQTMGVNEELNEHYRNTLKAFYSVIKTCDQYIRFAFLTGVTKFSKISIFSDLNNLEDISLRNDYAGICGITEQELEQNFEPEIEALSIAEGLTRSKTLAALKKQYDGYLFAKAGVNVYNPFSLLSAFKAKDFGSYWFSTGTPTFLVNYLKEAHYFIPDLDGKVELNESGLDTYRAVTENALPILFQSGYLTIIGYSKEARLYKLGFPNDEVRYGFLENLLPAYSGLPLGDTGKSVWQFVQDIREGKVDSFMERMKSIIAGIPYDNFTEENRTIRIAMDGDGSMQKQVCHANLQLKDVHGCTSLSKLREQNYQTAVYLVFALMGQFVQTEVHCSSGRADCIVWTAETIYLFEFKLTGNGSAEDALNQIKEKEYAAKYQMDGKKVVLIGVGFDEQKRTIKDWQVAHG